MVEVVIAVVSVVLTVASLMFALVVVWQQSRSMRRQAETQLKIARQQAETQRETIKTTRQQLALQRRIANVQIRAEVISRNRQEWINTLRNELADFISYLAPLLETSTESESEDAISWQGFLEHRRQIDKCAFKIDLLINPKEKNSARLADIVNEIRELTQVIDEEYCRSEEKNREPNVDRQLKHLDDLVEELVPLAQGVLKREWERVKRGE